MYLVHCATKQFWLVRALSLRVIELTILNKTWKLIEKIETKDVIGVK